MTEMVRIYGMESMRDRVGRNVRRFRDRIGLSQAALAEAVEMSETSIGLLERGKVWPIYDNIVLIAQVLQVPESALFEGEPTIIPPTPAEAIKVLETVIQAIPPGFLDLLSQIPDLDTVALRDVLKQRSDIAKALPGHHREPVSHKPKQAK